MRSPFNYRFGLPSPFYDNETGSFSPASLFSANEPGVWFDPSDLTTLFQDPAGTTPVTAPGNTVGLMLDKSKGLALGAELVDAASEVADWNQSGTNTIALDDGAIKITFVDNSVGASLTLTALAALTTNLTAGKTYRFFANVKVNTGSVAASIVSATTNPVVPVTNTSFQPLSFYFVADGSNETFRPAGMGVGEIFWIKDISVRELAGNHATQATLTARPTYSIEPVGGRRNLQVRTEEFANAAWTTIATSSPSVSVVSDTTTAPDGTSTADTIAETTLTSGHVIFSAVTDRVSVVSGLTYTMSVYAKKGTGANAPDIIQLTHGGTGFGTTQYANFNISTGDVTAEVGGTAAIILENGWYRCSFAATCTASGVNGLSQFAFVNNNPTAGRLPSYAGVTSRDVFLWGAQFELGSTATAYQRVTTQHDVTEAGVASVGYLYFDGTDDAMVTSTITPGIDKAQVFAGVRKLSDAVNFGSIAELSPSTGANNGSFYLSGPYTGATYGFSSRGDITSNAITPTSYAAPITNVLTGLGDISGDTATIRVNGAQAAQTTTNQGTGNYLAYPLYIGRRGGIELPFNGQLFPLIVRFGPNLTTARIEATESWVASKTAGVTL